ncbi:hypothetical protein [Aliiruegeria lutimaris]|uniref:Uncharacterized protein n=1 Tax=Aliiruegeria lutimaris TaxID=571298 RepID=A0A1G9AU18_9RHOB|nr:hypothetical protein [Aliiruegeria lutimaris]SDK30771.1 hypothetical protein SAMN04488026_103711 [Aliiruegeria lutimaris]
MRRSVFLPSLLLLCATFFASSASADFVARNWMKAAPNPTRAGYFEVFQKATAGPSDYWCAAGEFVRYGLREHNTTRIYVVRGLGPSQARKGRHSVLFSYVKYDNIPDLSDKEKGYSVSISKPGYHLSAAHGSSFCRKSLQDFRKRGLL